MGKIRAIVTIHKEQVAGGAPIFIVDNEQERQQTAFRLEKILDAAAHDLQNGTMIIVQHGGGTE
ncbi:hypothetical protein SAMN02799630_00448 [Paenibacillus sp. UNCCL117]|uniref:capping complex subunit for YIEGIA n=1 Tax=unclassified Paenibacillus TaxID=185978 RepID=UPI000890295E|nr:MULTISPECIES: hypothetical protein [unclassified Paenibacillus]SDC39838.1 hypothetical protein SAMN04488602_10284 [Paenibacillus sp. cl123]SFW13979.1 hypothetical protein SAMN02799630_00448 [Paenibacillus sp. UNCCL117]